ncbi:MAG: diguanylate cyclase [Pseudazoarcus pumilus]|nr:diguanylate cyclase [Pseudazoarcus pumilus]
MRLTLRQRLLLIVLVPALLLAGGLTAFLLRHSNSMADAALRERAQAIVSFLAPAAEYGVISGNRFALEGLLEAVLDQRDVAAASIVDADGLVLASSGRRTLDAAAVVEAAGERGARVVALSDGRMAAIAPVSLAAPRIDETSLPLEPASAYVIGWVHVELDTRALTAHKRATMSNTLAITTGVLLLTLLLALGLASAVTRPLVRLADAVREMSRGGLDARVNENARIAELRTLQQGFNTMAAAIADAQHTMQQRIDEATEQLAHQATHDLLTGLPNRRAFEQGLEDAVNASRRASDAAVLCFLDLDRFKQVNDSAGHAAGDALLSRIAGLIRERVRNNDLLCRIGGDEFGLILHACRSDEAHHIAETLRKAVAEHRFEWEGQVFSVGLSVGLVPLDGRFDSPGNALVAADMACYEAKRKGRNGIVEYTRMPGDS